MQTLAENYYKDLLTFLNSAGVSDEHGHSLPFYEGISKAAKLFMSVGDSSRKAMFIGNGASASISSHMAADFSKNAGIRAITFNDVALLTAMGNDFGYSHVFEKPMDLFADRGDLLCAISSSGRSENILRAVHIARQKKCHIITLSGFEEENPLRASGELNFFIPSPSYGHVEVLHHSICHCILNTIIEVQGG